MARVAAHGVMRPPPAMREVKFGAKCLERMHHAMTEPAMRCDVSVVGMSCRTVAGAVPAVRIAGAAVPAVQVAV